MTETDGEYSTTAGAGGHYSVYGSRVHYFPSQRLTHIFINVEKIWIKMSKKNFTTRCETEIVRLIKKQKRDHNFYQKSSYLSCCII